MVVRISIFIISIYSIRESYNGVVTLSMLRLLSFKAEELKRLSVMLVFIGKLSLSTNIII